MRIELLGPSGVGKTAVLKKATEIRNQSWLSGPEIKITSQLSTDEITKIINIEIPTEFTNYCFDLVSHSDMRTTQKLLAFQIIKETCYDYAQAITTQKMGYKIVHEELFLHRAFSFIHYTRNFEKEAHKYFKMVPIPDIAIIFRAPISVILQRIADRGRLLNCYGGKTGKDLEELLIRLMKICDIAKNELSARQVVVKEIDTTKLSLQATAEVLNSIIDAATSSDINVDQKSKLNLKEKFVNKYNSIIEPQLKKQMLKASSSFRKKDGRHYLRTPDVMYCSFYTPKFSIKRDEAQRDSEKRILRFGITPDELSGKSILDLGCNIGAMLFQISNMGIASGVGLEYDIDKVNIAKKIATMSNLKMLTFRQADIDQLVIDELGEFDVVFALAIEAHVLHPDKLYELLGGITKKVLFFEGNSSCNIEHVKEKLRKVGFSEVIYIGFCDDDIVPDNNNRPMFKAYK